MSEVDIAHQNNYDIDQPDIVKLLNFSKWRDIYPTGLPIFAKHIGHNTLGCNTLYDLTIPIYTIPKYFIDSNISPRVSDLLNTLKNSTVINYKWYQDVFVSRNMLQQNCHKPCWKERFIDGLPPIFAHKVKHVLISANDFGAIYIYIYIYL